MAAEIVLWKNLRRVMEENGVDTLPDEHELKKLKESLTNVKGALIAIEAGKRTDGNDANATRCKLETLVSVLHEADDLVDCIFTTDKQRELAGGAGYSFQRAVGALTTLRQEVRHFLTPRNLLIVSSVKKIRKRIEQLANELEHNEFSSIDRPERPVENHSEPVKIKVTGRKQHKKEIVDMLLPPHCKSEINVSVIPVLGESGLGKSTLAWLVYEDDNVKGHFDLRMWIQVSNILDEEEVIQEILRTCTTRKFNYREHSNKPKKEGSFLDLLGCQSSDECKVTSNNNNNNNNNHKNKMNFLEGLLRREIEGKLYLLVLDDACVKKWVRLKAILAVGAAGSRIIVTTRSPEVASFAKHETDKIVDLKGLSESDSWCLFRELALRQEDLTDSEFEKMGKSIGKCCKGVPLSIMVAGSFLYGKSKEMWLSFNKDLERIENKRVMSHILEQSYNDLCIRLKACFGYCSLFPLDFEFSQNDLISLWMAQGFVPSQEKGRSYFLELSRRNFFQNVILDDLRNIVCCKMHPLMHSLGRKKAAGIFNMFGADKNMNNALDSAYKHFSFNCSADSSIEIPPSLFQAQSLRTIIFLKEPDCVAKVDRMVCNMLIMEFKCLRVMDLQNLGIGVLPESIGSLVHLRYLDVSKNDIVTLPRSITGLYNLSTLKLNFCHKLRTLSCNFSQLVNLKRFELQECGSLTSMPLGLENLTQLEMLSHFIVGKACSKNKPSIGLKALKQLNGLSGRLEIELRGDWIENIGEISEADLYSKSGLTDLRVNWAISDIQKSSDRLSDIDKLEYQEFLENLQPNPNLKILCIEGYKGSDFPSWAQVDMLSTSLPYLVVVSIEGCDKCEHLPPFGKLQHLKRLTLRHMANVVYVETDDESLADESDCFFHSLEELTLHNFYNLEAWRQEVVLTSRHRSAIRYFPHLSKLKIWNCPKLTSMPLFPWVSNVDLQNINHKLLEECTKKLSKHKLEKRKNYHGIKSLQIKQCPDLKSFRAVRKGLRDLPCLEQLAIDKCDALASLSSEFPYLSCLRWLEISSCKELVFSDNNIHNMENNTASSWRSLQTFNNLSLRNPWRSLQSLRHLILKEIPKMRALPEGLKHVHTLKYLCLSACCNLEELPEWIGSFPMLQHLRIESCLALKRLPDGIKRVRTLIKVEITECPDLMERCRDHTGEDWHKIKHARIFLHKSWRYGLMSDLGAAQHNSRSNVPKLDDVKHIIVPVIKAETVVCHSIVRG